MNLQRNAIAYILIAFGALALLSRYSGDTGWLWMGLVAAAFLYAYRRERRYGFLVVGAVLAGIAGGIMLEELLSWDGAFLFTLGLGFAAIDRVEPRSNRWPFFLGMVLIGLGLFSGLTDSGLFGSFWFALLLIGGGIWLLNRSRERNVSPRAPGATPSPGRGQPTAAPTEEPAVARSTDEPVAAEPAAAAAPPAPTDVERRVAALEAWRSAQAETEGRALYLILPDETLRLLAEQNPHDLAGVRSVKGIGPVKLERYGADLLEVLAAV